MRGLKKNTCLMNMQLVLIGRFSLASRWDGGDVQTMVIAKTQKQLITRSLSLPNDWMILPSSNPLVEIYKTQDAKEVSKRHKMKY